MKSKKQNTTSVMKQYRVLLNQNIDVQNSGSLIAGNLYRINDYQSGDDFTVSGAANNDNGTYFKANGVAPTWANNSQLVKGFEITPTIVVTPTFNSAISLRRDDVGYNVVASAGNEFTIGKTFVTIGTNYRQRAFLGKVANKSTSEIELHSTFDGTYSDVNVIENNFIELLIEVYP